MIKIQKPFKNTFSSPKMMPRIMTKTFPKSEIYVYIEEYKNLPVNEVTLLQLFEYASVTEIMHLGLDSLSAEEKMVHMRRSCLRPVF